MKGRNSPDLRQQQAEIRGFDAFELRLGDVMRGERATLGKSLIDVQRELKIKATYIAAIENAEPSAFDTPGFIAGYVRSYSRYLGLDPEWAWQSFCREAGFEQPHGLSEKASSPRPMPRTGLDALGDPNASFVPRKESPFEHIEMRAVGSIAVLVALIGGLGYGAWAVLQEVQRVELAPVDQAPGVVAELEAFATSDGPELPDVALSGQSAGLMAPTADALDRFYRPRPLDVPVLVARDGPISAVEPGSEGALAQAAPTPSPVTQTQTETAAQETPAEVPLPQVVAPDAPELAILAVRPAWVQVTSVDGTVVYEGVLPPGERWVVPATEEPPLLRSGNAGATYFEVSGQAYGPAGASGQVVRNVPLAPDALTQDFALADMDADPDLAAIAVADAAAAAAAAIEQNLQD